MCPNITYIMDTYIHHDSKASIVFLFFLIYVTGDIALVAQYKLIATVVIIQLPFIHDGFGAIKKMFVLKGSRSWRVLGLPQIDARTGSGRLSVGGPSGIFDRAPTLDPFLRNRCSALTSQSHRTVGS